MSRFPLIPYEMNILNIDKNYEKINLSNISYPLNYDLLELFQEFLNQIFSYSELSSSSGSSTEEVSLNQNAIDYLNQDLGFDADSVLESTGYSLLPDLDSDVYDNLSKTNIKRVLLLEKEYRPDRKSKDLSVKGRAISGLFRYGESGYSYPILDTETGKTNYITTIKDANLHPFYFLLKIPKDSNSGILILQNFGNMGIKTYLMGRFSKFLKIKIGDSYKLDVEPIVPKDLVKHYLLNAVSEIRLIKRSYKPHKQDISDNGYPDEEEFFGNIEVSYKSTRQSIIPSSFTSLFSGIEKFLKDDPNNSIDDFIQVKKLKEYSSLSDDFKVDNVKIKVRVAGSYRTIDISNTDRLKFSANIDSKVKINKETGYPEFESMDDLGKKFLIECALSIWGGDRNE